VPLPLADCRGLATRRRSLSKDPKCSFGQCHRSEIRRMAGEAGEGRSAGQSVRHHRPPGRAEKPSPVRSVAPADANRWPADRRGRHARPGLPHGRDRRSGESRSSTALARLAAAAIVCGR
jgi:hypothetical protein